MNTTSDASQKCQWCGKAVHTNGRCPDVKAIEFNANGTVKRVEFFAPNDYGPKYAPRVGPDPFAITPQRPAISWPFDSPSSGGYPYPLDGE